MAARQRALDRGYRGSRPPQPRDQSLHSTNKRSYFQYAVRSTLKWLGFLVWDVDALPWYYILGLGLDLGLPRFIGYRFNAWARESKAERVIVSSVQITEGWMRSLSLLLIRKLKLLRELRSLVDRKRRHCYVTELCGRKVKTVAELVCT